MAAVDVQAALAQVISRAGHWLLEINNLLKHSSGCGLWISTSAVWTCRGILGCPSLTIIEASGVF